MRTIKNKRMLYRDEKKIEDMISEIQEEIQGDIYYRPLQEIPNE